MKRPYSVQKIVNHPKAMESLKGRLPQSPIQIHFMPALACNHNCSFCSYGHRTEDDGDEQFGWKNMEMMSNEFMPEMKMVECVESWKNLGVKCIEVTGGGEPLIYPHIDRFFSLVSEWGVDVGLVSNGTALTESRANLFNNCNWKWARISIDAGSVSSYCLTRRVPESHWAKAWGAVRLLAERKSNIEQRVGVGYVVDRSNWSDILRGCELAKEFGADNIRISAAFTPQHLDRFPEGAIEEASRQAAEAKERLEDDGFQVNNLFDERIGNLSSPTQDYDFCGTKEVLCVVGGDQKVYTCCTLAFNKKGLIGSIKNQSFKDLWESEEKKRLFACHRADRICNMECLYERRNKRMLELMSMTEDELRAVKLDDSSIHINFI